MTPDPREGATSPRRRLHRPSRRWVAGALVVLSVVAITTSFLAIWTRQTVYDTDRFIAIIDPALRDPGFYDGLSTIVTDASLEAIDLEARVTMLLDGIDAYLADSLVAATDPDPRRLERLRAIDRPTLGALAPAISQLLEERVAGTVDRFLTSEEFRSRLPDLVRRMHTAGVALVTDDLAALPNVYLEGDEVRIDLLPIVVEALREVAVDLQGLIPDVELPAVVTDASQQGREQLRDELAASLEAELPEDLGQVTVMQRSVLTDVQTAARYANRSVWTITVLAAVLLVAAILVSRDRRRTILQLALGVIAGLTASMALVRWLEGVILARITDPDGIRAVGVLLGELVTDLRAVTLLVVLAALVVGVLAYMADHPDDRSAGSGPRAS